MAASSRFGPRTQTPHKRGWREAMKQPCLIFIFASAALCLSSVRLTAQGKQATPRTADGHPDLSGVWNGNAASPFVKSEDPLTANLSSRDGTLLNFERDGTLIRRANPNKPLYKPEFWEKVQKLDQNGNTEDPSFGCMPAGVPRMGPPAKIVQTPKELIFLYVSPAAGGWGGPYRVVRTDGRRHNPREALASTGRGESQG